LYLYIYLGSPSPVTNLRVLNGSVECTTATILWNEVLSNYACGLLIYLIARTPSQGNTTINMTSNTNVRFDDLNPTISYIIYI